MYISLRATGSHAIGQVDCRESDDGLLDPAIENGEVSRRQTMNRRSIRIEHGDVDLSDVRGGTEYGHLLRAAGQDAASGDDGDEQKCVGPSHRFSRDSGWILALRDLRMIRRIARLAEPHCQYVRRSMYSVSGP